MKKRAGVLSRDPLMEAISYLPDPHRQAALIAWYTAARMGEVLKLHRDDVTESHLHYRGHKTKTGESRVVPLTSKLRAVLDELPREGWLFPSRNPRSTRPHISRQAFHWWWKRIARELGYPQLSGHSFRRSSATHLMREGVPLRVIQEITGHASLNQLQAYLAVDESKVLEAFEAL